MADRVVVAAAGRLLEVLASRLATWSRNTLRQRLQLGCITVNGIVATRHDQAVESGDVVEIRTRADGVRARAATPGLPQLFADDDLIAVDKPAGLLSVSTDDERTTTALAMLRAALSRPGVPAGLWPVHRLDRETSGVLLFARSRAICEQVQAQWSTTTKVYLAVVEGVPVPPQDVIDAPLWEDRQLRVRVGAHADARPARTRYQVLQTRGGRALLEVTLETGRKHQIRAHLMSRGHPVVGDDRYGTPDLRLGLHALRLSLRHPRDGRQLSFEAPPPAALLRLLA